MRLKKIHPNGIHVFQIVDVDGYDIVLRRNGLTVDYGKRIIKNGLSEVMRKKYRIRIYDCSDRSIKLERKKKFGSYIYKESAPLTKEEFYRILDGDYQFLLKSPYPLCREFYVECVSNLMRPRTIVDYDRVPWIMDEGTVRITFDSDVRAAVGSYDIFDPSLPTLPVLEAGKLVMEVKFTEMLPQIVRDLLPPNAQEFTAVSKYVLCYEKSQYLHGFEYWNETQERKLL